MSLFNILRKIKTMKNNNLKFITTKTSNIVINNNELALRLGVDRGFHHEMIESCKKRLQEYISYKCVYICTDVDLSEENICNFGFVKIPSKNLYENLKNCKKVFIMAVTTGIGVDRLLARLNIVSQAEHFITDALSSAAAESFCNYVSDILKTGIDCAPRFSPGYGDVSIEFQKPLLQYLNAAEYLGISLNSSYLMTPVKSITAIMGIKNEKDN